MIQTESKLTVCDNSGAREAKCIRVLGGTRRRYASVGDVIVVAVQNVIPSSDIKKGAVSKALIVRTKKELDVLMAHIYVSMIMLVYYLTMLVNFVEAVSSDLSLVSFVQ